MNMNAVLTEKFSC